MAAVRTLIAALAPAFLLAGLATPVAAQMLSEGTEFLRAIEKRSEDSSKVTEILNVPGATVINARDLTSGRTALHIVVADRDASWLSYLISQRANVNLADNQGVTPLMLAVQIGYVEGVEALLAARARVDVTNSAGETPLMFAVHSRSTEVMRVLLQAGADPDRRDNSGRSARDYARLRGANDITNDVLTRFERPASQRAGSATYGPSF
ncbi:ankyrin repeat domain-containing protein [Alteraurantiacibacter buctensis]|uniref:Ankyrin repeat domain-containing protein n=1 Tax=Alteraurantiacibacter buctensis TaxID=1503981 RepID=A0A844Z2W9_9SPHN|nr:ankyrin repeat domain-containing protein [Alteraurantiacibacter buctensis]MXO73480.1 ankyrin repeat domain-containing protein [Alteraurantiacibacter buctensis]